MRVSYLITLYNKAPFLPHLLSGLAAQTGEFTRQYVFVDDGSTDDTEAALRKQTAGWKDITILSQKNSGPARALNAGIAALDGDYIKPVDGDDYLYPWATSALLDACRTCNSEYAYAPMELQHRYDATEPPRAQATANPGGITKIDDTFLQRSLRRALTNPSVWIASTRLIRKLGGSDQDVFVQDYSLELRLAASGPAAQFAGPVMAAPATAEGRLSDNEAQTLHDVNLALLRFLRDHKDLPPNLRHYGMQRAAGRAWNWGRRHANKGLAAQLALLNIAAKIGLLKPTKSVEARLCAPFKVKNQIRVND